MIRPLPAGRVSARQELATSQGHRRALPPTSQIETPYADVLTRAIERSTISLLASEGGISNLFVCTSARYA